MLEALSPTTLSFLFLALAYFLIRFLNSTDQPKIKGLPEVPGVPLFGNLLQLGEDHARVTAAWAKKVRLARFPDSAGQSTYYMGEYL